jgi:putative NADPH-quinone reductase
MSHKRILVIQGHPDAKGGHLCHALAQAYADGTADAGHDLRRIDVAHLDFPLLRSAAEWEKGTLPASLLEAQQGIEWAQHLVVFFPLWLGDMPALLKGFLEQVARPGFAFHADAGGSGFGRKGLTGRSARLVVTMGMPALVYRFYFRAHSVKSLERNVLGFVGIAPVHETLVGMVDRLDAPAREKWLTRMRGLGRKAE